jgi:hypothetical protein
MDKMSEGTPTIGTPGTDPTSTQKPPQDRPNIRAGARSGELRTDSSHGEKIKKKLGLSQRTCEVLSETIKSERAEGIVKQLGNVKLGWLEKFLMKWRAGRSLLDILHIKRDKSWKQNYRTARGALRAKLSGLAKDTWFLDDLAKAVSKLDGQDFNNALEEIYNLLGGDTANRRDFFINKLLIPCAQGLKAEAEKLKNESQGESSKDAFIGRYKNFLARNKFFLDHGVECTAEENEQVTDIIKQVTDIIKDASIEIACRKSIEGSIFAFLATKSPEERKKHLADMCIFVNLSEAGCFYVEGGAAYNCMLMFISNEKCDELLKCFGEGNSETQIANFKKLIDDLRSISESITKNDGGLKTNAGKFAEEFNKKLVEHFSQPGNKSQMGELLKLANSTDNNKAFFMAVMLQLAHYKGSLDNWMNIPSLLDTEK